jgi:enoyl-CoA hydratase
MSQMGNMPSKAEAVVAAATGSVSLAIEDGIAEIALSNGPMNLVTRPMLRQLNKAISDIAARQDIRCVIVHGGEARAFCAGSDIKEFDGLRYEASEYKILFEDMVLRNLAALKVPTLAALNGHALGGGFEIALCCDLRVLERGAKIGLPENKLGGLAGNGAVRITRLIGPSRAKQLLFTGELISDEICLEWGLVNYLVEKNQSLSFAKTIAHDIAGRGPLSNAYAKKLVDAAFEGPVDMALSLSTVLQQKIFESDDLQRGAQAFLNKTTPDFKGN